MYWISRQITSGFLSGQAGQGNEHLTGQVEQPHSNPHKAINRLGEHRRKLVGGHTQVAAFFLHETARNEICTLSHKGQTQQYITEEIGEVKQGQPVERRQQPQFPQPPKRQKKQD